MNRDLFRSIRIEVFAETRTIVAMASHFSGSTGLSLDLNGSDRWSGHVRINDECSPVPYDANVQLKMLDLIQSASILIGSKSKHQLKIIEGTEVISLNPGMPWADAIVGRTAASAIRKARRHIAGKQ